MKRMLIILAGLFLLSSLAVQAQDLTGQQILDDLGFSAVLSGSGSAELAMITESAKGAQRSFSLRVFLKGDDAGDRQFLEYLAPADVRGTKFLNINEKGQDDQMWLYLPAMGRERRIASHMKGDSFMGTDFTYEEIGGDFADDQNFDVERLADAVINDLDCYVLALTAKTDEALYDGITMWVWKAELVPVRVEFSDSRGTLVKTLTLADFRLIQDQIVPHDIIMADNTKGTRTLLNITSLSEEEVDDEVFTLRYLRR